jgi:secreted protein with Ig-like and vWFA domain
MAFFMSRFSGFAPTTAGSPIPRKTMKTDLTTICIVCLLLAACGEKQGRPAGAAGSESHQRDTRKGILLTTELPPELIEGTPRPIILPRFTSMSGTRQESPVIVPRAEQQPLFRQALPESPQETGPGESMIPGAQAPPVDRERYNQLADNTWQSPRDAPLSTFSVDVDTASYSNLRRLVLRGGRIPPDAVRLEEMVNYFDYAYPQPADGRPFAVHVDNAACPWNPDHQLVRVALKGREIDRSERAPANLVFLLDVSGSMQQPDKLPLVVESFHFLLEEMNASDTISIVVYAGAEGLLLPPTSCDAAGRERIAAALRSLRAGGSTNGGAGIQLAYQIAKDQFKPGGINRVILATDGDFNVGITEDGGLVRLVEENAKSKVFLSVLGFGTGNLNDGMLEAITNKGNGAFYYIDSIHEARRVFLQKMMGTLVTIAKDVKIQVEFNPGQVRTYRLLGYANRMLRKEDFSNDRIDAGDIGAGHTVTAFYEIEPGDVRNQPPVESLRYGNPDTIAESAPPANASAEWLTVKLRYKQPEDDHSALIEKPFTGQARELRDADADFRFAAAVTMTALLLRDTEGLGNLRYESAAELASSSIAADPFGLRAEFLGIVKRLATQTR